jgi:hypothetical protein
VRVYVASSWRNSYQPSAVKALRSAMHEVYDFRNPGDGETGFGWASIDAAWQTWNVAQFRDALRHPFAERGSPATRTRSTGARLVFWYFLPA